MRSINLFVCVLFSFLYLSCSQKSKQVDGPRRIEILFLGHDSQHHNSAEYMPLLASALSREGINFTYTDKLSDLNDETLSWYDGLMIYANHDSISPSQEKSLLDFVANGKGFLPVHCASFCFQNSEKYIDLVGGQFLKHDTAVFVAEIIDSDHPTMKGLEEFSTWDETYIHHKLSADRTLLMERVDGEHREPWTWVKEHGKGRVFYTAFGHDERTWNNPGFHQLMKQATIWAVGDKVKGQWEEFRKTIPELVYKEVPNIPNYEKRDPAPRYQEPLSPEQSKTLIQVPVGFDLELFASEPDIINPIAMDWDERGRLWVIETVDYPNSVRDEEGIGDDRIKICEDTDGDGKADKFTIFADKLNIPTSLVFANDGIIVSQAPVFLFLKDTDGDDKADVRETIINGWGTFDTHAGPSNLKYGFDNQIWGTVGYSGFKGTIAGKNYEFAQGLYRFARNASNFEFLTSTSNNTWGLGFTENNDVFASTANNTHSVFMGISDRAATGVEGIPIGSIKIDGHYAMHPITDKVRQVDVFGGFTAAAGHSFYTARAYPEAYWNTTAFVCEPTGHLVHMARIVKDGAGFIEKDGWNLFAGADEWVSPVEAKVGPDGAVWVLDWYNFIVQHNPTPTPDRGGYQAENGPGNAYQNPLRDKSHGRIWRVVNRDAKPYAPIQLSMERPQELVAALSNDNLFWRMTAQRLLVDRNDKDVLGELSTLVSSGNNDAAVIHALWTIHGLGAIQPGNDAFKVVKDALVNPSAGVRKAAIQILSQVEWADALVLESNVLEDPDPNTRLTAILSLTTIPSSINLGRLLYALSKEQSIQADGWLSKAVYVAASQHQTGFMAGYLGEHPDYKGQEGKPEIHRESQGADDADWKIMELPQRIEKAGLDIDGVIWFRKTVTVPANQIGKIASLSLGPINDSDDTWVNGSKVGSTDRNIAKARLYNVPSGLLKGGKNSVSVKVQDFGGSGGIYGKAEQMFLQIGNEKISLAGGWKYDVEKEFNTTSNNPFEGSSVADLFMNNYFSKPTALVSNAEVAPKDVTVITIKVVQNEMKYDLKTFSVEAGKPVEIILVNPDFMQHNLVIAKQGTMKIVGAAADILASDPKAAEMNYVPAIPEVLFATKLANPQETVRIQFTAPKETGDYPYVCTFPGHWSIMNGVMKVVNAK
ncbi:MAG: ThuA domain-containing protein [Cyclobacteriaceae bacterium]|nr:ThuA domain-containing protein [Cyclobacteriaceae bacterium]